jgi:pyridoxamine 5'-phosphate oxidase
VPLSPLREDDVDRDAIAQFRRWYEDAERAGALQPDAMIVATATVDARPSARAVLLRGVDERGFSFFTNFGSRKGREIDANPQAAVLFHWPEVQRQVRATGRVERVGDEASDAYWVNRPRSSQISAWASRQSEPIASRAALEANADDMAARFAESEVPPPEFWGGYRVVLDEIEFWQHREDRLHDRLLYRRCPDGSWSIERLQP